jgi:hypothetical protein
MDESTDLRETTALTELCWVLIQKLQKTGKITNYCKKLNVMTSVIYRCIMLMRLVYHTICNLHSKTFTFQGDFCHGGIKSKQWVTVLLMRNANGSDKLPPLVIGKYKSPHSFKNVRKLPTMKLIQILGG